MVAFTQPNRWQMPPTSTFRGRWAWGCAAVVITLFLVISTSHKRIAHELSYGRAVHGDNLMDVQNRTLGFQKIFAISLPARTDQHDLLTLASKVSDLEIDLVMGVNGKTDVEDKVLPPGDPDRAKLIGPGNIGAWRAHMNVIQQMVRENIQTALILEADVDWDLRIKDQLVDFAKASRLLVQPLKGTHNTTIDPTSPEPKPDDKFTDFELHSNYDRVTVPTSSPYGDVENWDMFWIGHCGTRFTEAENGIPLGRVLINDDPTVPQPKWLDMQFGTEDLKKDYPNNTRVVHHAYGNVCTLAYAVTQKAAQKLLYEIGLHKMTAATDIMYRDMCDGRDNRPKMNCLSVQPQIMQHHRPAGIISAFTDIGNQDQGVNDKAYTKNVRMSAKINIPQLVYGWDNYTTQWRDDEDPLP